MSDSLFLCELNNSLPDNDNVFIESIHRLVDPIDDRIDSSYKINLCSPSVDTYMLKDCALSYYSLLYSDNVFVESVSH